MISCLSWLGAKPSGGSYILESLWILYGFYQILHEAIPIPCYSHHICHERQILKTQNVSWVGNHNLEIHGSLSQWDLHMLGCCSTDSWETKISESKESLLELIAENSWAKETLSTRIENPRIKETESMEQFFYTHYVLLLNQLGDRRSCIYLIWSTAEVQNKCSG